MAQPTPYQRLYDFSDFQTVNPSRPLPGSNLDAELDAVKLTTDQLRANIGLIQRDDGKLANQSVTTESLSAGALAMIHQGEYNPRGSWAASLTYALGDVIEFNAATYLCIVAHTSTPSFANDRTAGLWLLIANGALTGQSTAVDLFQGTGSQTVFTLSFTYSGNNAAVVYVSGVAQIPGQDFTISGTTLTFVSAPPAPSVAGRANVMVRGTGVEAQLAADAAGTSAANAQGFANSASSSATSAAASQTAAAASQTAAATSASNAASSATSAQTSATTATTQATSATNSATAAAASQSAAATSATNAAASASTATTQATTATTQATNAAGSATAAANSATSAAGSATTATNQAATATTQAGNAATSANNAATSATAAGNSATAAATSATGANNSAISATNSASSASTSASTATTQASNAATSATNAATSATTATTQASNASTSATNAAGSATAAASSATAAAASYDEFDDRFLGAKTSNPTVDNDGNALLTGALYFNSVANEMRVWNGTAWQAVASLPDLVVESSFTATAGQTSAAFGLGGYRIGFLYVYVNGVLLSAADITATDGSNVTFASALAAGDEVRMLTFKAVGSVTTADIGALNANNPSYTGTLTGGTRSVVRRFSSDTAAPENQFYKYRGTEESPTVVSSGDSLGRVQFFGYDGAALRAGAEIRSEVDATPGASDMPGRLSFFTTPDGSASLAERMRIDSAGNVGIGTSSPAAKLDVSGAGIVRGFLTTTDAIKLGGNTSAPTSTDSFIYRPADNALGFGTASTERMRIDSAGNVGIGTSSPGRRLEVNQASTAGEVGAFIKNSAGSTTGNTASLWFGSWSNASTTDIYNAKISALNTEGGNAATALTFWTYNGSGSSGGVTERMRIDSGGNVLVGTTSSADNSGIGFKVRPIAVGGQVTCTMDTNGGISTYHVFNLNATNNGYRFYVNVDGGIANFSGNNVNLSDERTKKNIEVAGSYLDKICAIPVKLFNYKDEAEGEQRTLGVIAQDVEAVAPEFVNNDGWEGTAPEDGLPLKTIYTTDMMFGLMKAIQEQQAIIESLKTRIEALEGTQP